MWKNKTMWQKLAKTMKLEKNYIFKCIVESKFLGSEPGHPNVKCLPNKQRGSVSSTFHFQFFICFQIFINFLFFLFFIDLYNLLFSFLFLFLFLFLLFS